MKKDRRVFQYKTFEKSAKMAEFLRSIGYVDVMLYSGHGPYKYLVSGVKPFVTPPVLCVNCGADVIGQPHVTPEGVTICQKCKVELHNADYHRGRR